MKIAIGCDHGGIALKSAIVAELQRRGIDIVDVGCFDTSSAAKYAGNYEHFVCLHRQHLQIAYG